MPITTLCLLRLQTSAPSLPHVTKLQKLDDAVLLHTSLDFADEPEEIAFALREALGEPLASKHVDARGVFLIPSAAAPSARTYAGVIDEVGEGGVWAVWEEPGVLAQGAALSGLLNQMLGSMPESFRAAAASLASDPDALKEASALLGNPSQMAQLMGGLSTQMPELSNMLRGMGIDASSTDLQAMSKNLEGQLQRDPAHLSKLAESLFAQAAGDDEADDDDDASDDVKKR